jgi:hypothetical protein
MRVPITKEVDPGTLADQLKAALGIDVVLSVRNPGQKDNDGVVLPGVIVLINPATGNELPDQDLTKINTVLAAHTLPSPPVTPARALSDALATATNLQDIKAAIKGFADNTVTQERPRRVRP